MPLRVEDDGVVVCRSDWRRSDWPPDGAGRPRAPASGWWSRSPGPHGGALELHRAARGVLAVLRLPCERAEPPDANGIRGSA